MTRTDSESDKIVRTPQQEGTPRELCLRKTQHFCFKQRPPINFEKWVKTSPPPKLVGGGIFTHSTTKHLNQPSQLPMQAKHNDVCCMYLPQALQPPLQSLPLSKPLDANQNWPPASPTFPQTAVHFAPTAVSAAVGI